MRDVNKPNKSRKNILISDYYLANRSYVNVSS